MSLIFHGPQSAGELLDVSLGVVKRHPALLARIGIWPVVAYAAFDVASRVLSDSTITVIMLPITLAVYSLGEAAVGLAAWRLLHGEAVSAEGVWADVRARMGRVAASYTLKWMGIVVGLFFFLFPAVLLLLRWFAVPLVLVVENLGIRAGFRRSRELVRGNRWQIFVTIVLLDMTMMIISLFIAAMLTDETSEHLPLWYSVTSWLWSVVYLLYHATLSAALYANARVRNEGYDLEALLPSQSEATA